MNNTYQYHIQWEGETKFGEQFQYSPEELAHHKQLLEGYSKVAVGKNYLTPSEEISNPVPTMGIPDLEVAHDSRMVNYVLSKRVEEVYVSPLEPHLFSVPSSLEPLFAIWRSIGTVTRPTLKAAALQFRDDIPFTYRTDTPGAIALVDAWEAVGRVCIVKDCHALDKFRPETRRKDTFFDHYYQTHMAKGWCTRYLCTDEQCMRLCPSKKSLDQHIDAIRDRVFDKEGRPKAAATAEQKERWKRHSSYPGSAAKTITSTLQQLWGADFTAPKYAPRPTRSIGYKRDVNELGRYKRTTVLLTLEEESQADHKKWQTYGEEENFTRVHWPYHVRHGDIIDEIQTPLLGFDLWVQTQTLACQKDVSMRKEGMQMTNSQFEELSGANSDRVPRSTAKEVGTKRERSMSTHHSRDPDTPTKRGKQEGGETQKFQTQKGPHRRIKWQEAFHQKVYPCGPYLH